MNESKVIEKNRRRKKIILINSVWVLIGYILAQTASVFAKFAGQSSITYTQMLICLVISAGITLAYIAVVYFKKTITIKIANIFFLTQFVIYIVLYIVWIYFLHEARMAGLFFALLALSADSTFRTP